MTPTRAQCLVGRVRVLDEVATARCPSCPTRSDTRRPSSPPNSSSQRRSRTSSCRGGGRPAVLVLRVLAPDDQRDPELDGDPHGDGEDRHVLGPRDVADLRQGEAVDPAPDDGVRRDLDVVDAQSLDVLDVASADRGELVGRRGHAERVHAELEHPDDLVGAVLAAADRDRCSRSSSRRASGSGRGARRARPGAAPSRPAGADSKLRQALQTPSSSMNRSGLVSGITHRRQYLIIGRRLDSMRCLGGWCPRVDALIDPEQLRVLPHVVDNGLIRRGAVAE